MPEDATDPSAGDPPRQRSSDIVFDELRDRVTTNRLKPGTPLSQVALAKEFGVSRIPVREALRQLAAEGLIVWEPGEMATVSVLERPLLEEVIEIRTVLEAWLVDRAIERLTPLDVTTLVSIVAAMTDLDDPIEWGVLNERFHATIHEAAGSLVAVGLVERLGSQANRFLNMPVDQDAEARRRADAEHLAIVDELQLGNRSAARNLLHDHLGHRLDRLGELLNPP